MAGFRTVWFLLQAIMSSIAAAQFTMWPFIDVNSISTALGISQACVNALNTSITCDPDLFRMAGQVDLYLWDGDNITTLCNSDCIQSSSDWIATVYDGCSPTTDLIVIDSKMVPVDTVATRYADGIGLACLHDQQLNITTIFTSANASTTATSMTSTTSSFGDATPTIIPQNDTTSPNVTYEDNYLPAPNFCFNQSQNWVGVDLPDCDSDPTDPLCDDPSSAMRLANYYNDSILCSPCFLSVMWWRINSPFLPDSNYSDYLIDQYQDIQDVCNVTMPDTLVRSLPTYADAPPPNYLIPGTDPAENTTTSSSNGTCNGQTLSPSSTSSMSCNDLSQKYGVSTGDLQAAANTDDCSFSNPICVPSSCSVTQIGSNVSCDAFAATISSSNVNVTTNLFLSWNPNIQGLCDSLTNDQFVCTGPPGGSFNLPPPLGNDTNAGGQQRGGQGSGANPNGPLGPSGPTTNSTAQAPTQPGIDPNCTLFAYAAQNDTCYDFSQSFSISLAQLTLWNPILGYPDGHNCTTQFWSGYDYCVQVNSTGTSTSTSTSSTATTTSSLPYPTQTGIDPACDSYAEAVSGDYCYKFAQDHNITTDQLYAWNMVLGPGGANCSTEFQAGYDYCIGVSTSTTTATATTTSSTSTTSSMPAVPTQSGIDPNCNKLVVAQAGDYCYEFAQDNNITTDQLYEWNTILGPNGQNCSTEFDAGYGYCVSVSS